VQEAKLTLTENPGKENKKRSFGKNIGKLLGLLF
jgi:hypothetical protein